MDFVHQFIEAYGLEIVMAILGAIATFFGAWFKKHYTEKINTKTKEKVVKICVEAVEQIYKELHGEEKYNKVVEAVVEMLDEKGIPITELELKMLIEATVGEFNEAFKKTETPQLTE